MLPLCPYFSFQAEAPFNKNDHTDIFNVQILGCCIIKTETKTQQVWVLAGTPLSAHVCLNQTAWIQSDLTVLGKNKLNLKKSRTTLSPSVPPAPQKFTQSCLATLLTLADSLLTLCPTIISSCIWQLLNKSVCSSDSWITLKLKVPAASQLHPADLQTQPSDETCRQAAEAPARRLVLSSLLARSQSSPKEPQTSA